MNALSVDLTEDLVRGYRESFTITDIDAETVHLVLPATFSSGRLMSVEIELHSDRVAITDRGLAAEELTDAQVNLESGVAFKSFDVIRASTGLSPVFGAEWWEITAETDRADLATAVQAVSDAAMRADGLRALSRAPRKRTFSERVINSIASQNFTVIPKAKIAGRRGGQRQVTARVDARERFFVQTLSGTTSDQRLNSYDHASGIFFDAEPDRAHRLAVIQRNDKWESWQLESLREICTVTEESDLTDRLAA